MIILVLSAILLAGTQAGPTATATIAQPHLPDKAERQSEDRGSLVEAPRVASSLAEDFVGPGEQAKPVSDPRNDHEEFVLIVQRRHTTVDSGLASQVLCSACTAAINGAPPLLMRHVPKTSAALQVHCESCTPWCTELFPPTKVKGWDALPVQAETVGPATPELPSLENSSNQELGDIVVKARRPTAGDPVEKLNVKAFAVTEAVDRAVLGPVSLAYEHTIPEPVRDGIGNFLANLHEPVIFLNFLIQLKPGKAAETVGRFTINSILGGAGLFDLAKQHPFNLPHRANGFADSMGYYGVKAGPFLFLPLMGPTTPRDLVGFVLDRLVIPSFLGKPFNRLTFSVPTSIANALNRRASFDEQIQKARSSDDPYAARRNYYLRARKTEIDGLRGRRHHPAHIDTPIAPPGAPTAGSHEF